MKAGERIGRAWRILGWKHWAWATGLGAAAAVLLPLQQLDRNTYWLMQHIALRAIWYIFFAYVFLAAIAWVEAGAHEEATSMSAWIAAALVASVVGIAVATALPDLIAQPPWVVVDGKPVARSAVAGPRGNAAAMALLAVIHGTLATLTYARLRNSRLAARALAQAEMERAEASRRLLDESLRAARQEFDPERVVAELDAIADAYDADPVSGEARLDALIAVLRGASARARAPVAA